MALLLIFLFASCATPAQETGVLQGHVTIGPLVPVVREGEPEATLPPEMYATRQIVIYSDDGRTEITRVQIDEEGNYRVSLAVSSYVVDINHLGIDRGIDLPTTVRIEAGEVTRLDVEIDTGIR